MPKSSHVLPDGTCPLCGEQCKQDLKPKGFRVHRDRPSHGIDFGSERARELLCDDLAEAERYYARTGLCPYTRSREIIVLPD